MAPTTQGLRSCASLRFFITSSRAFVSDKTSFKSPQIESSLSQVNCACIFAARTEVAHPNRQKQSSALAGVWINAQQEHICGMYKLNFTLRCVVALSGGWCVCYACTTRLIAHRFSLGRLVSAWTCTQACTDRALP
ncbi:hypothetical protein BD779DRAFT_644071 [Infundibulicybe gibba]|nr:hypothetical protein BD779DRAFT_644071 [Infundibulicybe gibba]